MLLDPGNFILSQLKRARGTGLFIGRTSTRVYTFGRINSLMTCSIIHSPSLVTHE